MLSGLVYNGLRPLDLAAEGDPRTKIQGSVRLLETIPFDYKERHPRLFDPSSGSSGSMQRTNPSRRPEPGMGGDDLVYARTRCTGDEELYYDPKCFTFEGSGKPSY